VPSTVAPAVAELQASLVAEDGKPPLAARAEALLLLAEPDVMRVAGSATLSARTEEILEGWRKRWQRDGTDWAGSLVQARYDAIGKLASEVVLQKTAPTGPSASDRIDSWVTHPVWGWLILLTVMTLLFLSIFTLANTRWIGSAPA
jgi:ferrous iron transport protein B